MKDYFEFEDGTYFAIQTNGAKVATQRQSIYMFIDILHKGEAEK